MEHIGFVEVTNISSRAINLKRSSFEFATINEKQRSEYEDNGWEFEPSKLKKSIKMKRSKAHHDAFEDRTWALFAKMGFDYLNTDNNFKVEYKQGLDKQIDVIACDNEAILVVECKSSEIRRRVSYQKDINELIGIKEDIRTVVQKFFPGKQKIAFIFATNNSILSENDKIRLEGSSIHHFNQDDIDYWEQLTNHLGKGAKYQLFGKLFTGQKIPELKNRVPAIKGKMASGYTFYSFSIDPEYLLKIGFILHRSDTNQKATKAYQRLVKKNRLKQIGYFINENGYFPNSIIINIETKNNRDLKFEPSELISHDSTTSMGVLYLPQTYKSAFIIDGQHRLYGYSIAESESNHTIPIVAFQNLPGDEQTRIFVDINHNQKSVPASLLHSIMADFNWNSPNDRLALSALKTKLFVRMNDDESSPFYKRIIISEEKKTETRCLTLQTLKNWGFSNVNFFGKLKGNKLIKTGSLSDVSYDKTLKKALDFFNNTFLRIEEGLNQQWNLGSSDGGFIAMNIGVSALIRTQDHVIEYLTKSKNIEPESRNGKELAAVAMPYLEPIIDFVKGLDWEGRRKLRSLFGSGATEKVVWEFLYAIYQEFPDFQPEGLQQWIKDNSGEFNKPSWDVGHNKIEPMIDNFIKLKLKEEFGEKNWWIQGIPKEIQKKCSDNRIEEGSSEPDWNFLNTIHYYTIIQKHWTLLGNHFTKPGAESEKKIKRIEWLQQFNKIRKKYSHPQRVNTTEEEYNFLVELNEWLTTKLVI